MYIQFFSNQKPICSFLKKTCPLPSVSYPNPSHIRQVLIKSLRELAESGGSNMATIEKYVRQSFSGAADLANLSKLLRLAAHKAVQKVNIILNIVLEIF